MNKLGPVRVGGTNPVRIMGVINTSPESFHKKSIMTKKHEISKKVQEMEEQGADFVDIGGMSTAPYLSTLVSEKVETKRISDAIKAIQKISNIPISIDTCRASVAKEALELGAEIINDISGLKYDKRMVNVIEKYQPSLVLCAFSKKPVLGNQVTKTRDLLKQSIAILKSLNVSKNNVVVDPAIGFFRKSGKNPFFTKINSDWVERDLLMIQNLSKIKSNYPLLISVSNKSFIGKILNKQNTLDRLYGSLAAEVISVLNGADIIRTHNLRETKDAIFLAQKLAQKKPRKAYNAS